MKNEKNRYTVELEIYKKYSLKFANEIFLEMMREFQRNADDVDTSVKSIIGNFFAKINCLYLESMKNQSIPNTEAIYILVKAMLLSVNYTEKEARDIMKNLSSGKFDEKISMERKDF